jgi:hypothetical protein
MYLGMQSCIFSLAKVDTKPKRLYNTFHKSDETDKCVFNTHAKGSGSPGLEASAVAKRRRTPVDASTVKGD